MLHIERMQIRLPAGFEYRAAAIAQQVSELAAEFQPVENRSLDNLSIGSLQVSASATDSEIAQNIVERIISALRREI